ncbi:MAG: protein kinase [Myxococcota bacterium]
MPILTDEERVGTSIGKYRLEAMLGEGGMGVVYRATNTATGRPVAVKLLRDQLVPDVTARKRFEREARAAAALDHPNVVDVLDLGTSDDGAAYIVLELLRGESLADLLERIHHLGPPEALAILLPVVDALAVAHDIGFAHRDLKPDNIFLAQGHHGEVIPKLLDFGLAKPILAEKATQLTATGSVFGTPGYMSPEQAQGMQGMDHVFDLWGMGVILFETMTGQMPFEAPTAAVLMNKILSDRAPKVRDVYPSIPSPVAKVVDRALDARRAKRHPSARALHNDLREAADKAKLTLPLQDGRVAGLPEPGEGPGPDSTTVEQPAMRRPTPSAKRWLPVVVASLVATLLLSLGVYWSQRSSAEADEGPAEPTRANPEHTPSPEPLEAVQEEAVAEPAESVEVEVNEAVAVAPEPAGAPTMVEAPPRMEERPRRVPMTMESMRGLPQLRGWSE